MVASQRILYCALAVVAFVEDEATLSVFALAVIEGRCVTRNAEPRINLTHESGGTIMTRREIFTGSRRRSVGVAGSVKRPCREGLRVLDLILTEQLFELPYTHPQYS